MLGYVMMLETYERIHHRSAVVFYYIVHQRFKYMCVALAARHPSAHIIYSSYYISPIISIIERTIIVCNSSEIVI